MTMSEAPKIIYLQFEEWEFDSPTWCVDQINDSDNEYIRKDEYNKLRVQNAKLQAACEAGYEVLVDITNSRKGSIGSIDNTYLPQLNRKIIDSKLEQLKAAIADVEGDE